MTIELTLASEADEALARAAGGTDGQGDLMRELRNHPLAKGEIEAEVKRLSRARVSVDHIHLARFSGTDLVQWYGRFSSGYHHPLGRLMKIVEQPR